MFDDKKRVAYYRISAKELDSEKLKEQKDVLD